MDKSQKHGTIQFVKTPGGEAPEWVRQAWVGLIVPYVGFGHSFPFTRGVVSGKTVPAVCSYCVPQDEALALLRKKHPDAAAWWSAKEYPKSDPDDAYFSFECTSAVVLTPLPFHGTLVEVTDEMMGDPYR
jgi:hypothetical protein